MLFNSVHFLLFFPIVVGLYFLVPAQRRWLILLLSSFYFYMVWRPVFVLLILLTVSIDYGVARLLVQTDDQRKRKRYLAASITANMSILAYFKYTNFALDSVRDLASALDYPLSVPVLDVVLPIGISFHTFQSVGYAIDVYRGLIKPELRFPRFTLFVMFFPQLVAGPIERAPHLLTQLQKPTWFDYDNVAAGTKRIIWGMFKKVVIADRLATYVNIVYNDPARFDSPALVLATYFFAFQIYTDFSAYSDIAVGAARVLGFDLMENFRRPYLAKSVDEFWRRWHISLSTWFRDYLYIPLGGNRSGPRRKAFNVFLVFVISGLWHGANWTYVIWGTLHGAFVVLASVFARQLAWLRLPAMVHRVWTFHLALVAWVFFRANTVSDALTIVRRGVTEFPLWLASLPSVRDVYDLVVLPTSISQNEMVLSFAAVGVLLISDWLQEQGRVARYAAQRPWLQRVWYNALVFGCLLLGVFGKEQFIYFQF
jgi:D-alanyl-lipoteichoic acid acyltransferase DltB (MBOAT superfamily)